MTKKTEIKWVEYVTSRDEDVIFPTGIKIFKDDVDITSTPLPVEIRYRCVPVIIKDKNGNLVYSLRWDISKECVIDPDDPSIKGKDIKYE